MHVETFKMYIYLHFARTLRFIHHFLSEHLIDVINSYHANPATVTAWENKNIRVSLFYHGVQDALVKINNYG